MISLFASIVGFLSSIFPDLIKILQKRFDKKYEIDLITKQIEIQELVNLNLLEREEIKADMEETKILHQNFCDNKLGVIDCLNHSVRPVLAYFFFFLYASIKIIKYLMIQRIFPDLEILVGLWGEEDQAIFAAIISFYFGQRSFSKFKKSF